MVQEPNLPNTQPSPVPDERAIIDREHLRLLALFHYVVGSVVGLTACILIVHFFMGLVMLLTGPPEMRVIGLLFAAIGGVGLLLGWTFAALTIYTGKCITNRKQRTLTLVVAGINCLYFPYGTILGIFTFMVLSRDSVKRIYDDCRMAVAYGGVSTPFGSLNEMPPIPKISPEQGPNSGPNYHEMPDAEEKMWQEMEQRHIEGSQ